MARSDWYGVATLVVCLIVATAALLSHRSSESYQRSEYPRSPSSVYKSGIARNAYTPYPIAEPDQCYRAHDRNIADLCAQWRGAIAAERAAKSAASANLISLIGTVLSAAGLFAIFITIRQGQNSTTNTLDLERARIALALFNDGNFIKDRFYLTFANFGRSMAIIDSIRYRRDYRINVAGNILDLIGGCTEQAVATIITPGGHEIIRQIEHGSDPYTLYGYVVYRDFTGQKRRAFFSQEVYPGSNTTKGAPDIDWPSKENGRG